MKTYFPFPLITRALLVAFLSSTATAQNGADTASALRGWLSLDAPPGWEHLATETIQRAMPGWKADALGNLVLRKGNGSPRRVVACALDRPAFAVTEITDDG